MARSLMVLSSKEQKLCDGGKYPLAHKTVRFHPFRKFPLCGRLKIYQIKGKEKGQKRNSRERKTISHRQIKA